MTTPTSLESRSSGVTLNVTSANGVYVIDGANRPILNFIRGNHYILNINASGHPFYFQTSGLSYNPSLVYTDGVTGSGIVSGTITFEVPYNAPSTLTYVCQIHSNMGNFVNISDGPNGPISITNPTTPSCRFCYSYKPQGFIQPCCPPVVSADLQTLSSISSTPFKVNNNINNSDQTMLLTRNTRLLQEAQSTIRTSTIQSTIANAAAINSTIYAQLQQVQAQRYIPYQPYVPPVIPQSVTDLQRMTANVGNPMPPFMRCKANQFITK